MASVVLLWTCRRPRLKLWLSAHPSLSNRYATSSARRKVQRLCRHGPLPTAARLQVRASAPKAQANTSSLAWKSLASFASAHLCKVPPLRGLSPGPVSRACLWWYLCLGTLATTPPGPDPLYQDWPGLVPSPLLSSPLPALRSPTNAVGAMCGGMRVGVAWGGGRGEGYRRGGGWDMHNA